MISSILLSERNNELLMKNHQSHPTGFSLFPEVNAISSNHNSRGSKRGEGRYNYRPKDNKNAIHHQKWENNKNHYPEDVAFSSIF